MLFSPLYPGSGYYVMEDRGQVIAFANIVEGLPDRIEDTNLAFPLYAASKRSIHIKQIAVSPQHQGQGVGTRLYHNLFYLFPGLDFYTYVRDSNIASLHFHLANRFYRVGVYHSPDFYGVHNYTAYLLLSPGAPVLPS